MSTLFGLRTLINKFRKTAILPPEPISEKDINDQRLSIFFGRLPAEVRQMIWQAHFGAHAVHIFGDMGRLRARECRKWPSGGGDEIVFVPGPHFGECTRPHTVCNKLPLLLTCKRMYISTPRKFTLLSCEFADTTSKLFRVHNTPLPRHVL
jgi:hypothetical protein